MSKTYKVLVVLSLAWAVIYGDSSYLDPQVVVWMLAPLLAVLGVYWLVKAGDIKEES
ncbi:MAG: hypothetical protein V7746_22420 [Halioglobus sp.]